MNTNKKTNMKKTFIISILLFAFALTGIAQKTQKDSISSSLAKDTVKKQKTYTITLTEIEIQSVYNFLNFCMAVLPTSKAPASDVTDAITTAQGFQSYLKKEYDKQAKKITDKPLKETKK